MTVDSPHAPPSQATHPAQAAAPVPPEPVTPEPVTPGPVTLTAEQIEALGLQLDALRARVLARLGSEDREYIYRILKAQRGFEVSGRALMYLGFLPPFWLAGVTALSLSKILDNMEIGHNVMHGQYDWMREPGLNSRTFEWDNVCPADQWIHSHNFRHHVFTNILGEDRDIGYEVLRVDEAQPWSPFNLGNPLYAFALMFGFEWTIMAHDLEWERILRGEGEQTLSDIPRLLLGMWRKASRQSIKDYVLFPALTGPLFLSTLAGNITAGTVRNIWAFLVIYCGHFPSGVQTFTREDTAQETRGEWYVRQMLGSANITGSPLFHIMTGNLSHQIEHHLFPDLPAHRYPEMAPEVEQLCREHGLPYNTGGFLKQVGSVWGKLCKLALPPSWTTSTETPVVLVRRTG
ncbi:fatty acid desaturase family protein [Nocardia jejuensis]|uniref:fatty acid desaturase family protein n=1 Tax=Nocardia jejuensis TaxID=328049 RepID=UPI0009FCC0EC|nr:acyl-CoA desaturase [Nocardia jejuensis]